MAKNNLKGVMRAWERHQQAKSMRDAMNGKFDTAPDARTARLEDEAKAKVDGVAKACAHRWVSVRTECSQYDSCVDCGKIIEL